MYVVLRQVSHSFQFLNNLTNRTWTAYFSMCKHKLRWETVYKRFKFFKDVLFEDFREAVWNIDWSIVFNFLRKAVIINICINYISKVRISNVCWKFWNFGWNLIKTSSFLGFMSLIILFISSAVACGKSKALAFRFVWFLILIMLGWFLYTSIMFLSVLEFSNGLLGFPAVLGGIPDEFSIMLM